MPRGGVSLLPCLDRDVALLDRSGAVGQALAASAADQERDKIRCLRLIGAVVDQHQPELAAVRATAAAGAGDEHYRRHGLDREKSHGTVRRDDAIDARVIVGEFLGNGPDVPSSTATVTAPFNHSPGYLAIRSSGTSPVAAEPA